MTDKHHHMQEGQIDWLGTFVLSYATILLLSILARVTHIKFAKKERGYSQNDFTIIPYYLMICNCATIMCIFAIELAGDGSHSWVLLILTLQLQAIIVSWAIAIQLFEWILCNKLVQFQGETSFERLSVEKSDFNLSE
jgi:hypothetical protein